MWSAEARLYPLANSENDSYFRSVGLFPEGVLGGPELGQLQDGLVPHVSAEERMAVATVGTLSTLNHDFHDRIVTTRQFIVAVVRELDEFQGLQPSVNACLQSDSTDAQKLENLKAMRAFAQHVATFPAHAAWHDWILNGGDCPESLEWHGGMLTQFPTLTDIAALCRVYLSGFTHLNQPPDLAGATQLTELCLVGCTRLSEPPVLTNNNDLILLDLSNCTGLTRPPDLDNLEELMMLILNGCKNMVINTDQPLHLGVSLTHLHLADCTSMTDPPNLNQSRDLVVLNLEGCTALTVPPQLAFTVPPQLPPLNSLKIINLRRCTNLLQLPDTSPAPNVTLFDISDCTNLTHPPEINVLLRTPVEILNLRNCTNMTLPANYVSRLREEFIVILL